MIWQGKKYSSGGLVGLGDRFASRFHMLITRSNIIYLAGFVLLGQ